MAETRKHNPTTSDIGDQVRALMGDTVRPVEPGSQPVDEPIELDDIMFDPFFYEEEVDEEPPRLTITAGGEPLIGVLPEGFVSWITDDSPAK